MTPVGIVVAVAVGAVVLLLGWRYLVGLRSVIAHPQGRRQQRWRVPCTLTGVVVLIVVGLSPLGELLEKRLSTHMAQHLVIITVAAPLLALGSPGQVVLAGLPRPLRRRLVTLGHGTPGRSLLTPFGWLASVAAIWIWHLPGPYDAAVRSNGVHFTEHATFLLTAWLFWARLIRLARSPHRSITAAAYVAAAVPPGAALGAVLTFADRPLYPLQAAQARASGIDPLLDQRIAGIVMWVPLDLVYLAVAIWLFGRWLLRLQDEARDERTALPSDARATSVEVR